MLNLYRLAYISKNNIGGINEDVKRQIESILRSAQSNNPKLNITGALLFSGGYFCQVIEGPEDNIEELFEIIQMDSRHTEITVLSFEQVLERGFSEWSMAFAGVEEDMRFDIDGIKRSKDELAGIEAGDNMISVLETLVKQQQSVASSQKTL